MRTQVGLRVLAERHIRTRPAVTVDPGPPDPGDLDREIAAAPRTEMARAIRPQPDARERLCPMDIARDRRKACAPARPGSAARRRASTPAGESARPPRPAARSRFPTARRPASPRRFPPAPAGARSTRYSRGAISSASRNWITSQSPDDAEPQRCHVRPVQDVGLAAALQRPGREADPDIGAHPDPGLRGRQRIQQRCRPRPAASPPDRARSRSRWPPRKRRSAPAQGVLATATCGATGSSSPVSSGRSRNSTSTGRLRGQGACAGSPGSRPEPAPRTTPASIRTALIARCPASSMRSMRIEHRSSPPSASETRSPGVIASIESGRAQLRLSRRNPRPRSTPAPAITFASPSDSTIGSDGLLGPRLRRVRRKRLDRPRKVVQVRPHKSDRHPLRPSRRPEIASAPAPARAQPRPGHPARSRPPRCPPRLAKLSSPSTAKLSKA